MIEKKEISEDDLLSIIIKQFLYDEKYSNTFEKKFRDLNSFKELLLNGNLDDTSRKIISHKEVKIDSLILEIEHFSVLLKFDRIKFLNCDFFISELNLENKNYHFGNCTFKNEYIISNFAEPLLLSTLYNGCIFEKNINIKNGKTISHDVFCNCDIKSISATNVIFEGLLFINNDECKNKTIDKLTLYSCHFKNKFIIYNSDREKSEELFVINELNFDESQFYKSSGGGEKSAKVKIQFCDIKEASFYNTTFEDLADFYQSEFKKVNFERTDFKDISVFSECIFNCDVDFKYSKFFGKTIFRDTVINKNHTLNLRSTLFDDDANFLDITSKRRDKKNREFVGETEDIKVKNRETARIIKSFFDNQNNTIDANRFYKLEMQQRLEEYLKIRTFREKDNDIFEMLVFLFHKVFSNHSQTWSLVVFWICMFTFIFSYSNIDNYCIVEYSLKYENLELLIKSQKELIVIVLFIFLIWILFRTINKKIHYSGYIFLFFLASCTTYLYLTKDYSLYSFSNVLNPFSIMTGRQELSFEVLIFKIIIAYLIYQLVVSIRQNTRRK